ncbi:S8 family serine peptidase [Roseateles sp. DAIF2]|uniref:S8 family peptidase n=1 Tax=Roseateles sp. DAIF2 TaxID=2714952 RepID=UPI0018A2C9DE|nr:S8 family peptidase [Roseateles sp. DAIF2]QPF75924.1 S8 family serine peptidase [Roseateles sp. DAIF2]
MKPMLLRLSLLSSALALGYASTAVHAASEAEEARVIVRFKAAAQSVRAKPLALRARAMEAADIAQTRAYGLGLRTGRSLAARLSLDERTHVITARGMSSAALAQRLAQDGEVEMVVVDQRRRHYATPNDSYYMTGPSSGPAAGQWYLREPSAGIVSSINAPAAWDRTTGSNSIVVAVLDTGIRKDHPDLAAQIVGGYDMVGFSSGSSTALAIANDGNHADNDASDPGDWVTQADINGGSLGSTCTSEDVANSSWHGTRVAGLIAATSNNGQGIAGVAWGSKILPVRVLGKCGGYDSDIIAGMRWAAGVSVPGLPANPNPARVLNLSLGGSGSCGTTGIGALYRQAISEATARNAVVVAAAGNTEGLAVGLPGNCPGVITVAGLRHIGSKVGFSSLGSEVTLAAPGGNCVNVDANGNATGPCLYPILSTTNSGSQGPVANDERYVGGVGTSFSTPLVSGVVALMLAQQPSLTPSQVANLLRSTVRPFVSSGATAGIAQCQAPSATKQDECYCTTSTCGAGMLDAAAAVAAATPAPAPAPAPVPAPAPTPAPAPAPAADSGGGGGGGGGAAGWAWMLGLVAAGAALRGRSVRRPAPRPAQDET